MSSLFPKTSAWAQEEEKRRRFEELPPDVQRNSYTRDRPAGLHTRSLHPRGSHTESRRDVVASRDDIEFVAERLERAGDHVIRLSQNDEVSQTASSALIEIREALAVLEHYQ